MSPTFSKHAKGPNRFVNLGSPAAQVDGKQQRKMGQLAWSAVVGAPWLGTIFVKLHVDIC